MSAINAQGGLPYMIKIIHSYFSKTSLNWSPEIICGKIIISLKSGKTKHQICFLYWRKV